MKINLDRTENIELTEAISSYLSKKLDMLDRLVDEGDESVLCDVKIGRSSEHHKTGDDIYYCEFVLHTAGNYFVVKEHESNLYAAIDRAKDQLALQLRRHKDRRKTLVRSGGRAVKRIVKGLRW